MSSFYPILVDLRGKKALVVGGGKVAQRKVETLLEYWASVELVARDLTGELDRLRKSGTVRFLGRDFSEDHLEGAFLVVAATDDAALNRRVSRGAQQRGLLVNAVDQPADCNFIVPSIIRRGDLLVAVSTSGKSPAMAKRIRERLEGQFGPEYETALKLMGRVREAVLAAGLPQSENSRIFHAIAGSAVLQAIRAGDWEGVRGVLQEVLPEEISGARIMDGLAVERGG